MELLDSKAKTKSFSIFIFITGIVLVAFNLRPAITSLGPLVGMIQKDVGLSHWSAGLLMSLPLVIFALLSPIVPKIANRLTNELTLLIGLSFLLIGILIRSIPMPFFLFTGTFLAGVGIAIGNVLLPAIVKDKFPEKFGLMTSVYSTSMGLVASLASGVSIPLAINLNLGWQGAQIVWAIPAVVAILVWLLLHNNNKKETRVFQQNAGSNTKRLWRTPLAWQIAIFMGFQSFLFYVTISWLPEILHSQGMSMETAGWMLSLTQLVGLPASFFIPVLAGRTQSQVWIGFMLGMCSVLGYSGLLFGSSYPILIVSITLIGLGLGGAFPLALTYIGLRARNANQAAALSGMTQSTGYLLAAVGPLFIGYLYDIAHLWTIPIATLIFVSVIVMIFAMLSGRNRFV
ncbi:MFS transporter [Neobacillus niacini]|uniref:CynX/NimT family MFS transporter n=1 Tax=Neobacillus niacini TaxID=86668 RepID=UPI0030024D08